jgi:hypothetical protein
MSERETQSSPEPSASVHADRRAFVRLASELAVCCRPAERPAERVAERAAERTSQRTAPRPHDVGWPGRVRDISRGGVGLILQHRFRPGTELSIELRENSGKLLRTVGARVAHASAVLVDGSPCWLLGCSFAEPLSDEEWQALG